MGVEGMSKSEIIEHRRTQGISRLLELAVGLSANQAMIYPWDRGTNYAVELGQKAARIILGELD